MSTATMIDDKQLDQLAKILNQAENTTNENEKKLFFARAQKLSTRWSIELAVARSHVAKLQDREQPIVKTINLAKAGTQNRHVWCSLFMAIGGANDLEFNIAHNSTYVVAFGMPSDIALTEALYASISVQMIESCQAFLKTGAYKDETVWDDRNWCHKPQTSRVAKRVFFENYSSQIGSRLRIAKREAQAEIVEQDREQNGTNEEGQTGTELVLYGKTVEVRDFYKQNSRARGSWKGGRGNTYSSNSGASAGRQAAQNARLGGEKSIGGGGRKAIG